MSTDEFDSPEAAALGGFPTGAVHVVAARSHGDDAYVLLDTRPAGPAYLYGVECFRRDRRWYEGASSNGGGWTVTDTDAALGMLVAWDHAPAGAERVRIAFDGDLHEEPVESGVYLTAWWRVPCPETAWPELAAYRLAGTWIAVR